MVTVGNYLYIPLPSSMTMIGGLSHKVALLSQFRFHLFSWHTSARWKYACDVLPISLTSPPVQFAIDTAHHYSPSSSLDNVFHLLCIFIAIPIAM